MYEALLAFITAFIPSYFIIPSVIKLAHLKKMYPHRKESSNTEPIPELGGIALFSGIVFSVIFWTPFNLFGDLQYMLCAFVIIFLIGVKDDLMPMAPSKKLIGELMAASILVLKADVRISSFFGILGIGDLPYGISVIFSLFTIIVIINSFNLIDGINGLSGSIAVIVSLTFGTWFFLVDKVSLAILGFSLAGAVIAFLKFNFTPAKIIMGDTGALLLGLICSILTLRFVEINKELLTLEAHPFATVAAPSVAIALLILPLTDTVRVFLVRIMRGKSPFVGDRLHIHHLLIDYGYTHTKATFILVLTSMTFMFLGFTFQSIGAGKLLILVLSLAFSFSFLLQNIVQKK